MSNRLSYSMEWAVQVRNEILEYRVRLDHLPAAERGQHYRGVIQKRLKSLKQEDQRADPTACLRALEELFPAWLAETSAPSQPVPTPVAHESTAEELAEQLLEKAAMLPQDRRAALADRLKQVLPLPTPPPVAAPSPRPPQQLPAVSDGLLALDLFRERFRVADGKELDFEMVLLALIAVAELLHDILKKAGVSWGDLAPTAKNLMNENPVAQRLGRYLATDWKQSLERLKGQFGREGSQLELLSIQFPDVAEKLGTIVQSERPDPAMVIGLLRGIVELQLPHPSMVIAMLNGGVGGAPLEFEQKNYHLFDWRSIERTVQVGKPSADGRDFWLRYKAMALDNSRDRLRWKVKEAILAGARNDAFCPEALK